MSDERAQALQRVARYRQEPGLFAEEGLGVAWWHKQLEIAEAVRDHPRVAVKACHASGKTKAAADVAIWYMATHCPSVVISTAPTNRQVAELLWREMRADYHRSRWPLGGTFYDIPKWNVDNNWYALGLSTKEADSFQGHHSENMLVIVDEAAGVAENIFEAIEGIISTSNAKLLLIGNPTSQSGAFYNAFHSLRHLYHCITINALETPNFQPDQAERLYLITPTWIEERRKVWGENHPLWYARVLGEFSPVSVDSMIALQWIEKAQTAWADMVDGSPVEIGVDVARMGTDETVLVVRRGMKVTELQAWQKVDTMETTGRVIAAYKSHSAQSIKVDVVGIGAGVVDRLRELGYPVVGIESGGRAREADKYINLRAEMWSGFADLMRQGLVGLPPDDVLAGQLAAIKYQYRSSGQMQIESKEDLKKRVGYSPDRGDAVVYAFADLRSVPLSAIEQPAEESRWTDWEDGSRWRT